LDMLPALPTDTPPMLPLPTDTLPLDTDADTMERDLLKLKPNQRPMLLFFMVDTDMVMLLDTPGMDMLPDLLMDTPPMLPLPTDTPPLDMDAGSMERDLLKPSQKLMLLFFMVDMDMVMVLDTPDLDMLLALPTDTLPMLPLPTDTPPLGMDTGTMERDLLKPSQKLKLMLLIFMVDMDTPDLDMLLTLTDTLLIPLPIPLLASLTTVK